MKDHELFAAALSLPWPWYIKQVAFEGNEEDKVLHIYLGHSRRVKFNYEGKAYPIYDHQQRKWEHLKFFQHRCIVHAGVPRVKIDSGLVKLVEVPWAQAGSSFTLLYEYDVLNLIEGGMNNAKVGQRLGIGSKRVFGIVNRHVSQALSLQSLDPVKELSVDETSSKKGHNYLTIMADRERKKVVGVAVGKDHDAFAHALIDMEIRGANREEARTITMDMSTSYIKGAKESLPQASIVFDRFHIAKKMNEAVDEIRRQDQRAFKELKNSRYLWLRNNSKLKEEQRQHLEYLALSYTNIGTAYRLKEQLHAIFNDAQHNWRIAPLQAWMKLAQQSKLAPVLKFVKMMKRHWYGIKSYFKRLANNAYAERVNLKIQEIKRSAKGYRNLHNFMIMIYFHLGGLDLKSTK